MLRTIPVGVDLWIAALGEMDAPDLKVLREPRDCARYRRIIPASKKRNFLLRRSVRNHVLDQYLEDYRLEVGPAGKPTIVGGGPTTHFNASSSGNLCAVAVSAHPLGIDIERRDGHVDMIALCKRFVPAFDGSHRQWASTPLVRYAAYCAWCRLEAHTKLDGRPLAATLFEDNGEAQTPFSQHSTVLVVGHDYICAISQRQRFDLNDVIRFELGGLGRETGDDHRRLECQR